ncbi:MAG TPA: flagellar basal body rod C-terminal domain-containing protein [Trichococcus sp.]|nr:flagellar basal body rod C-terminal domain-containing protein [Trichococcus sp.]
MVSFLEQRKSSISGVSINEEVVNIMKFQSAFQANAKVLAVTSEMLDTLINRTGV